MSGAQCMERGVWVAPWLTPNGEKVLAAVKRDGRLVAEPVILTSGLREIDVADRLWNLLDEVDPAPALAIVK